MAGGGLGGSDVLVLVRGSGRDSLLVASSEVEDEVFSECLALTRHSISNCPISE